jgi:hypothetical protein
MTIGDKVVYDGEYVRVGLLGCKAFIDIFTALRTSNLIY